MLKIKQDSAFFYVDCDKEEAIFIKNDYAENIRLFQHIIYSLGLDKDSFEINIKVKQK